MLSRYAVILISSLLAVAASDAVELDWYTIDGGGAYSAGGNFELEGTIGQPDAGMMSGGAFTLTGGFWAGATVGTSLAGDCDADGDVDFDDFAGLEACLLGPGGGLDVDCDCFDLDGSGDIDLFDFAEFQVLFAE